MTWSEENRGKKGERKRGRGDQDLEGRDWWKIQERGQIKIQLCEGAGEEVRINCEDTELVKENSWHPCPLNKMVLDEVLCRYDLYMTLSDPVRQICTSRSLLCACYRDLCETNPDSQQVPWREQSTKGQSALLLTECHLKFRLLDTYKQTLAHIYGAGVLIERDNVAFFFSQNTVRALFSKVKVNKFGSD